MNLIIRGLGAGVVTLIGIQMKTVMRDMSYVRTSKSQNIRHVAVTHRPKRVVEVISITGHTVVDDDGNVILDDDGNIITD